MGLTIKEVGETNWRAVCGLTVAKNQKGFIESNARSLLEAAYDVSLHWQPLALYDGELLVGFSMIGAKQEEEMWLDRLMIDAQFQGKGYGTRFIPITLQFMRQKYGVRRIYLSIHDENEKILPYYQRFGFIDSGKYDPENGERIMFLDIE